ncbi:putative WW domain-containing protein [Seiridium cardinale]
MSGVGSHPTVEATSPSAETPDAYPTGQPVKLSWKQKHHTDGSVYFEEQSSGFITASDPLLKILQVGDLADPWEIRWTEQVQPCFFNTKTREVTGIDPRLKAHVPSEINLPDGWEMQLVEGTTPYFVNKGLRLATPHDPRNGGRINENERKMPPGWEMRVTPTRQLYFVDHNSNTTSWQDPRSVKEEEKLPPGWELRWTDADKPYFVDHNTQRTVWTDPRLKVVRNGWPFAQDLPNEWKMQHTSDGRIYFMDNETKSTIWIDPRYRVSKNQLTEESSAKRIGSSNKPKSSVEQVAKLGSFEGGPRGTTSRGAGVEGLEEPGNEEPDESQLLAQRSSSIQLKPDSSNLIHDDSDEVDVDNGNYLPRPENPAFVYSLLESPTHIRILDIYPAAKHEDPIICTLRHENLETNPTYEALSYTWGNMENRTHIHINSQEFLVRENAAAALQQLRQTRKTRSIWIDAICINQADNGRNSEKSTQLPLMTRIYEQAEQVCIWLGELEEGSDVAMKSMKGGRWVPRTMSWTGWKVERRHGGLLLPVRERFKSGHAVLESSHRAIEMEFGEIREILHRPWWTRVWIMQEAIVARKLVLICGEHAMDWNRVETTAKNLRWRTTGQTTGEENISMFHDSQIHLASGTHTTINRFREKWIAGSFDANVYMLLDGFRGLQCTNPHDRIFAFLGLAGIGPNLGFIPNYESPIYKSYASFARFMIRYTRSTDILNCTREWRGIGMLQEPVVAYSMIDQARYHDIAGLVSDGQGQKPRLSWVRLPDGWERCQDGKKSFMDWNTGTRHSESPLRKQDPLPPQPVHMQRLCPAGWEKLWDNLGRPRMTCNPKAPRQQMPEKLLQDLSGLPSWAPNWAAKTSLDPAPLLDWSDSNPLYSAGGNTEALFNPNVDSKLSKLLSLHGLEFDHIAKIGEAWHPDSDTVWKTRSGIKALQSWDEMLDYEVLSSECSYAAGKLREEAFWRTHLADIPGDKAADYSVGWAMECWYEREGWVKAVPGANQHASKSIFSGWSDSKIEMQNEQHIRDHYGKRVTELLLERGKANQDDGANSHSEPAANISFRREVKAEFEKIDFEYDLLRKCVDEYKQTVRRIYKVCPHRRLFVTTRGYFGLAPWNAEQGDTIVVLAGSKTPFLVRRKNFGGHSFQMIGESYVYGIMAGEAFNSSIQRSWIELV